MSSQDPMLAPYYSCDLEIPIVRIDAHSKEQAKATMNLFIDKIAEVMKDIIHWDEADWKIRSTVYDETEGVWVTQ